MKTGSSTKKGEYEEMYRNVQLLWHGEYLAGVAGFLFRKSSLIDFHTRRHLGNGRMYLAHVYVSQLRLILNCSLLLQHLFQSVDVKWIPKV